MSDRGRQPTAAGKHGGDDAARKSKARRNAWLLGAFAVLFYLGYMAWMLLRSSSGG